MAHTFRSPASAALADHLYAADQAAGVDPLAFAPATPVSLSPVPRFRPPPPPWLALAYEDEVGVEDTEPRPARPGSRSTGGEAA